MHMPRCRTLAATIRAKLQKFSHITANLVPYFLEIRDIIATNWAKRGQKRQAGMGDTFDKPA